MQVPLATVAADLPRTFLHTRNMADHQQEETGDLEDPSLHLPTPRGEQEAVGVGCCHLERQGGEGEGQGDMEVAMVAVQGGAIMVEETEGV